MRSDRCIPFRVVNLFSLFCSLLLCFWFVFVADIVVVHAVVDSVIQ